MLDAQWTESSSARRLLHSAAKRLQLLAVALPSELPPWLSLVYFLNEITGQYVDDNDDFLRILAQPSFR